MGLIDPNWIPLTRVPHEAAAMGWENPPGYRQFYTFVLDGALAASQVNGRYRVHRQNLRALGVRLGGITSEPVPTASTATAAA